MVPKLWKYELEAWQMCKFCDREGRIPTRLPLLVFGLWSLSWLCSITAYLQAASPQAKRRRPRSASPIHVNQGPFMLDRPDMSSHASCSSHHYHKCENTPSLPGHGLAAPRWPDISRGGKTALVAAGCQPTKHSLVIHHRESRGKESTYWEVSGGSQLERN